MEIFALILTLLSLLPFVPLMAWTDSASTFAPLSLSVSDSNASNWADAASTGAVPLTQTGADSFTLADFTPTVGLSYRLTATETANNWADSAAFLGSLSVTKTDNANNWADAVATFSPLAVAVTDSANNWADDSAQDVGEISNDLPQAVTDSFTLSDPTLTLSLTYDLTAAETANNWDDATNRFSASSLTVTDNLANWADGSVQDNASVTSDLTKSVGDSFTFTDAGTLFATESLTVNDSFTISDGTVNLTGDYLAEFSDSFAQSDAATRAASGSLAVSDALPTIADDYGLDAGQPDITRSFSDSFTLSDGAALRATGSRAATGDSFTFSDTATKVLGIRLAAADSFALSDASTRSAVGFLSISDSFTLSDSAEVPNPNLSLVVGDSFTLTDNAVLTASTPGVVLPCPQVGAAAILPSSTVTIGPSAAVLPDLIAVPGTGAAAVPGPILEPGAGSGLIANLVANVAAAAIITSGLQLETVGAAIIAEPVAPAGLVASLKVWGNLDNGC